MGSARDSAPDPKRASGLARPPWPSRVRPHPMSVRRSRQPPDAHPSTARTPPAGRNGLHTLAAYPSTAWCCGGNRHPYAALRGFAPPPAAGCGCAAAPLGGHDDMGWIG